MKILNFGAYLDGGTISVVTDQGTYCFDNRIRTKTKDRLYEGYPKEDNSNLIEDSAQLEKDILQELRDYKHEFYQIGIDGLIKKLEDKK